MVRMPYLTTNDGCRLFYQTMGLEANKPVIVFLNGTMQNHLNWKSLAKSFTRDYGVLVYDARAQGLSDCGSRPLSLERHVSDLKYLVDFLKLDHIRLVGLSHGARVALAFSMKHANIPDRLVMCSIGNAMAAKAGYIVESWKQVLITGGLEAMAWAALPWVFGDRYLSRNRAVLDKMVGALVRRNRKEALLMHLDALLAYGDPDHSGFPIGCPTLVLSGSEDPIAEPAQGKQLSDLCHGRHQIFDHVGHTIPAEAPERFTRELIDFL